MFNHSLFLKASQFPFDFHISVWRRETVLDRVNFTLVYLHMKKQASDGIKRSEKYLLF